MERRAHVLLLLVACLVIAVVSVAAAASRSDVGKGVLTSVEPDGSLIISEHGYLISPYAIVRDGIGQRVELKHLKLPIPVTFEYGHSARGPVIKVLRVSPR